MRVLVCGGRDFDNVGFLWRTLDDWHEKHPIARIIEGASDDVTGPYIGADYWARQWAFARNVHQGTYHAEWKTKGRAAGPIRNQQMIDDGKPDLVIAFPGGRGTANMVNRALAAGLDVHGFAPATVGGWGPRGGAKQNQNHSSSGIIAGGRDE